MTALTAAVPEAVALSLKVVAATAMPLSPPEAFAVAPPLARGRLPGEGGGIPGHDAGDQSSDRPRVSGQRKKVTTTLIRVKTNGYQSPA